MSGHLEGLAPIYIKFAVACSTSCDPEGSLGLAHWNSPAGVRVRSWMFENGLITSTGGKGYIATSRLKEWIAEICKTPLPEVEP